MQVWNVIALEPGLDPNVTTHYVYPCISISPTKVHVYFSEKKKKKKKYTKTYLIRII